MVWHSATSVGEAARASAYSTTSSSFVVKSRAPMEAQLSDAAAQHREPADSLSAGGSEIFDKGGSVEAAKLVANREWVCGVKHHVAENGEIPANS